MYSPLFLSLVPFLQGCIPAIAFERSVAVGSVHVHVYLHVHAV
jgi:hypothetical protein